MLQLLAQATSDYSYGYQTTTTSSPAIPAVVWVVYLAVIVLMLASLWKVFTKAGKPGWASIVPFYNSWVLVQIAGKPALWFFLMFVPIVNIVIAIMLYIELAKAFGKSGGFAALLILLPFIGFPMLAFGKAQYHAPGGAAAGGSTPSTPPAAPSAPADPTATPPAAPTPPASQPPAV